MCFEHGTLGEAGSKGGLDGVSKPASVFGVRNDNLGMGLVIGDGGSAFGDEDSTLEDETLAFFLRLLES